MERTSPGRQGSFHVVGRDVDFVGTDKHSDLAHTAKKMNRECSHFATSYPSVDVSTCGRTGRKINLLDLAVYSRNRAMRTIYSSKEGSEDTCFKPCAGFERKELAAWWIVRDRGNQGTAHTEPWDDQLEKDLSNVRPVTEREWGVWGLATDWHITLKRDTTFTNP